MSPDTALVLIDVQVGMDHERWGERNNPGAEGRIAELLGAWRTAGAPVVHVRHASRGVGSPLHPESPGFAFKPEAEPEAGEPVVTKSVNSAFIGTDLETRLRTAGIRTVVLAGISTPHCVSTTARMAANLGFPTVVVSDATAAFALGGYTAEVVHAVSLATLEGEFAAIVTADQLVGAAVA